jgi:integrase
MILVAYRHGLRASEVCDLQWHQVELEQGRMHVRRAKWHAIRPSYPGR